MARIYVGVGSKESPGIHIRNAIGAFEELCTEVVCSPIYMSQGVAGEQGTFTNLVIGATTLLPVDGVVVELKAIERANGRQPGHQSLDLDLLLYDDLILNTETLKLPRNDIERFVFVLKPLAEMAPALVHPVSGLSIEQMWKQSGMDDSVLTAVDLEALEPR